MSLLAFPTHTPNILPKSMARWALPGFSQQSLGERKKGFFPVPGTPRRRDHPWKADSGHLSKESLGYRFPQGFQGFRRYLPGPGGALLINCFFAQGSRPAQKLFSVTGLKRRGSHTPSGQPFPGLMIDFFNLIIAERLLCALGQCNAGLSRGSPCPATRNGSR